MAKREKYIRLTLSDSEAKTIKEAAGDAPVAEWCRHAALYAAYNKQIKEAKDASPVKLGD
jgi:hypothetical protein